MTETEGGVYVVLCDVCGEQTGVTRPSHLTHREDGTHWAHPTGEDES